MPAKGFANLADALRRTRSAALRESFRVEGVSLWFLSSNSIGSKFVLISGLVADEPLERSKAMFQSLEVVEA